MKNSWYSRRGLKQGLLLGLLACLVWAVGVYGFLQAQVVNESSRPQFEMTPMGFQLHNCVCETRT
jgi:4-amino-4-deoxy-L-arabinose transferase-like glycosyltransferase